MEFIQYILVMFIVYAGGRLVQRLNLPAILGWLITGIIIGPTVLNLLTSDIMNADWYNFMLIFINAIVGMMLGSSIDLEQIKKAGKEIVKLTFADIATTFIVVTAVFGVIFYFMDIPLIIAALIGGIATITAPAPPVSVVNEYETDGPVTRTLLPLTILNVVSSQMLFFVFASVLSSYFSETNTSVLIEITLMLIIPIVYGVVMGILANRFLSEEKGHQRNLTIFVIYTLATLFIGLFIDQVLYPEPSMSFLLLGIGYMAGFVNTESDEVASEIDDSINTIQQIALMALIANLAAPLDPRSLFSGGLIGIIYMVARMFGKWSGIFISAKAMNLAETVQKYLGITLFPHAGISLVLAGVGASAASQIAPEYGELIMVIIPAAAIVNEIIAVILSKKAFEWAGEVDQGKKEETKDSVGEQSTEYS